MKSHKFAVSMRPDIHRQGKKDAEALGLTFSAYLALLISTNSPEKIKYKPKPKPTGSD